MMVLLPCERSDITGSFPAAREQAKLTMTAAPTALSFLEGGMMTARNIPKRATLSALTILAGSMFPIEMPSAVPAAHIGTAVISAPNV